MLITKQSQCSVYPAISLCGGRTTRPERVVTFPWSEGTRVTASACRPIVTCIEHEPNGQLPFLDTLISRDNERLNIDVYRNPTHTDRYLDFRSHHDRDHKISTVATLLHRALKLPNSEAGKAREIDRISTALQSNGYPQRVTANIIRKKSLTPPTPSPKELVRMFFSWADPTNSQSFAVLPYIRGISEPLTRILKSHDIRVTNKQTKHYSKSFLSPSLDLGSTTSAMWFIKSLVGLVPEVTSAKKRDRLVQGEK